MLKKLIFLLALSFSFAVLYNSYSQELDSKKKEKIDKEINESKGFESDDEEFNDNLGDEGDTTEDVDELDKAEAEKEKELEKDSDTPFDNETTDEPEELGFEEKDIEKDSDTPFDNETTEKSSEDPLSDTSIEDDDVEVLPPPPITETEADDDTEEDTGENKFMTCLGNIGRVSLLYIPNRLADITDLISFNVSAGPETGLSVIMTRWCQIGGSYGEACFIGKGYDRQYGGGYESGWNFGLTCLSMESRYQEDTFGTYRFYIVDSPSFKLADPEKLVYKDKNRDFWELGVGASWLLGFDFSFHAVEVADFLCGLFTVDFREDDWK